MNIIIGIKKICGKIIRVVYKMLYKFVKVDEQMIMFISFHGKGYSDNPKALYEVISKDERYKDYRFIWAIKKHKEKNISIPGAEIIEYFSFKYFYYMSKSKYWIINCKMPTYIQKKDEQIYLQTWHGTPLKRLAYDIQVDENTTFYRSKMSFEEMTQSYTTDVERYNYMITPNSYCTDIFQSAFRIQKDKIIETGYPRNDFLSNYAESDVEEIKKKYNIPKNKKTILYAPTWRDNNFNVAGYVFELQVNFQKWKDILGDDYVILFKPHYLIINNFDLSGLEDFVINIPPENDISDMYIISDMLITDYSSVFFDYGILRRPIYFYMYDIEEYADELRGFYLDINKDLPGPIFTSEEDMVTYIRNSQFDYETLDKFNQKFNYLEDGKASQRVMEIVLNK